MNQGIKTYTTEAFRNEFLERHAAVEELFNHPIKDFFCLRIQEVMSYARIPIPPSREDCHTVLFVQQGHYRTKVGLNEYTVEPGELVVVPAGAIFSIEGIADDVEGFACHFHPEMLVSKFGTASLASEFDFLTPWGELKAAIGMVRHAFVRNLFERLQLEYRSPTPDMDVIKACIACLLCEINAVIGASSGDTAGASTVIAKAFHSLIHAHVTKNLKVSDVAAMLNVSPNHLNKSVRQVTGKSASQLIGESKILEIKARLYQTSQSISEIADELGFFDHAYFSRFFKRHEDVTPAEYRRMIEKS